MLDPGQKGFLLALLEIELKRAEVELAPLTGIIKTGESLMEVTLRKIIKEIEALPTEIATSRVPNSD